MATHTASKEAHRRAQARYLDKAYKLVPIRFKYDEDKDILDALEEAQRKGLSYRAFIRSLFDKTKK